MPVSATPVAFVVPSLQGERSPGGVISNAQPPGHAYVSGEPAPVGSLTQAASAARDLARQHGAAAILNTPAGLAVAALKGQMPFTNPDGTRPTYDLALEGSVSGRQTSARAKALDPSLRAIVGPTTIIDFERDSAEAARPPAWKFWSRSEPQTDGMRGQLPLDALVKSQQPRNANQRPD